MWSFRLRTQLLLCLLLIGLLPIAIFLAVTYVGLKKSILTRGIEQVETAASFAKSRAGIAHERLLDRLTLIANQSSLKRAIESVASEGSRTSRTGLEEVLSELRTSLPLFKELAVLNHKGELLALSPQDGSPQTTAGPRPELPHDLIAPSMSIYQDSGGELLLMLTAPVIRDLQVIGVVVGICNAQEILSNIYEPAAMRGDAQLWLSAHDYHGAPFYVLLRKELPEPSPLIARHVETRWVPASVRDRDNSHESTDRELSSEQEGAAVTVSRYLKKPGWGLVYRVSERDLLEALREATQGLLRMLLFFVGLAVVGAVVLSRSLSRSILSLVKGVERVRAGQLDTRCAVTGSTEIQALATAFNEMTTELDRTYRELEERVDDNEQKNHQLKEEIERRGEAEEMFRLALEASPYAIVMTDTEGEIALMNAAAESTLAYSRHDLIGRNIAELFSSDNRDAYLGMRKACLLASETVMGREAMRFTAVKKNGERFPVDIGIHPISADERTHVLHSIVDLSKQDLAEETALRLASIVQYSDDAIVGKSLDGTIISWNHAAERMYGYSAKEMIGQSNAKLIPPDLRHEFDEIMRQLREGKAVVDRESYRVRKDGTIFPVSLTVSPVLNSRGESIGVSVIARDVSERKEGEKRLKQSLRDKDVLLREVHHRVKNNMQIICSLIKLQSDSIGAKDPTALLEETHGRVTSLALVHEKLYQSTSFSSIDFTDYVRSLVTDLLTAYRVDSNRVRLELSLEPVLLSLERAIPCGLILNELVSNVFKHAFPGDRAGTLALSLTRRGATVTLVIRDDGVGLQPDFDLRSTHTLGMELVQSLSEQVGATVRIGREGGTSFTLTFADTIDIPLEEGLFNGNSTHSHL